MEIDIVIISNSKNEELKKLTEQSLNTLFDSEKNIKFKVFLIESNKDISFTNIHANILMIYPNDDFGYNKFLNIGIKKGNNEYLCICNNDLIFHKNWASNLITKMKENLIFSASPISYNPHFTKFKNLSPDIQFGYEIRKYLTGWCIFQNRKIYDEIGDLDENFIFWYADNDYGKTLEKHKIKHALITSSRVDHIESSTLKTCSQEEKNLLTIEQKQYFLKKWNL